MPLWLLIVVMALTTYRATRLITSDTFPPVLAMRDRVAGGWRPLTEPEMGMIPGPDSPLDLFVVQRDGVWCRYLVRSTWSPYWLAELVSCPWCCSGWVTGAVTLATDLSVGLPDPWLVGPAVWGAAALLASRSWA